MTHAATDEAAPAANGALRFDVLHVPANRTGGNRAWCDAFAVGADRYVLAVGEAAGDAGAALMMAAVRESFGEPAREPDLRTGHAVPERLVAPPAALVGTVDRRSATLQYVSSGQPAPCIRYRDGSVALLPVPGPADRTGPTSVAAHVVVDLRGAEVVLFYANALLGSAADAAAGTGRLRRILEDARPEHWARPATAMADALLNGREHDDVALLAVCFPPEERVPAAAPQHAAEAHWSVTWSFDTTTVVAAGVRRAFVDCLAVKADTTPIDVAAAELIFGELLGNVIRHAPGPVEIILDWTGPLPVLHMLDEGPGFVSRRSRERLPTDDWSESGRGLFIINACATAFSVRNRSEGRGTHASATLPAA
jgi:anti-sigma regulatory factor (Ser/Thr protein kinase)